MFVQSDTHFQSWQSSEIAEIELPSYQSDTSDISVSLAEVDFAGLNKAAWSHHNQGNAAYRRGDFDAAQKSLWRSRDLFLQMGDKSGIAWCLNSLGKVAYRQGNYDRARQYSEDSLRLFRETGDRNGIGWASNVLGRISYRLGDCAMAQLHFGESVTHFRALRSRDDLKLSLENLGKSLFDGGDFESARIMYAEALQLNRDAKDDYGIKTCLESLAHVADKQNDPVLAKSLMAECRQPVVVLHIPTVNVLAGNAGYNEHQPAMSQLINQAAVHTDLTAPDACLLPEAPSKNRNAPKLSGKHVEKASKSKNLCNQCLVSLWKQKFSA